MKPDILLLQGPIGPFFRRLQEELERGGANVARVLFNAGDELYGPRGAIRFSGTAEEWEAWLRARLERSPPGLIVWFGCKRPAHRIAARLAQEYGIATRSLEEGYLRPGYITCEVGGNNDLSPIKGRLPAPGEHHAVPPPLRLGSNFVAVGWWGWTYYGWRTLFSKDSDRPLFHREISGPWSGTAYWGKRMLSTILKRFSEQSTIRSIYNNLQNNYFLVPLQMPGDSQLAEPARDWTLDRLIEGVLAGFAKRRAVARIVFKLHPLDGDTSQRIGFIRQAAARHGLSEAVTILHSGSIAELTAHSAGMIIINSSSGLAAIERGVPLLMLGDGVFRNEQLVTCGADEADIDAFFAARQTAPADLRLRYLDFLAAGSMIPGDFYKRQGIAIGARNLAARLLAAAGQPAPAEQEPAA